MKFTKTIAIALANKTRKNLEEIRKENLKNFKLSQDKLEEISTTVGRYLSALDELNKAKKVLESAAFGVYFGLNPGKAETMIDACTRRIAEKSVPEVPSYDELVDDFLIESMEANNAEELIAKIVAKYSK